MLVADVVEYYIKCTTPENYRNVLKFLFKKGYVWWASRKQDPNIGVGENRYIVVYSGDKFQGIPKNIAHGNCAQEDKPVIDGEKIDRKAKLEKLNKQ